MLLSMRGAATPEAVCAVGLWQATEESWSISVPARPLIAFAICSPEQGLSNALPPEPPAAPIVVAPLTIFIVAPAAPILPQRTPMLSTRVPDLP